MNIFSDIPGEMSGPTFTKPRNEPVSGVRARKPLSLPNIVGYPDPMISMMVSLKKMVALDLPIMASDYAMIQQQFSSNSAATFHNVDTFSHIHIPMLLAIKGGPLGRSLVAGQRIELFMVEFPACHVCKSGEYIEIDLYIRLNTITNHTHHTHDVPITIWRFPEIGVPPYFIHFE